MAALGPVELGFAEEAPAWRLRSEQFPSKVGGRPAWLGLAGMPGPGALACARCGRPLAFLLQVYAPLPGRDDAFHRSLFLFCCREPPCCAGLRGERPVREQGRGQISEWDESGNRNCLLETSPYLQIFITLIVRHELFPVLSPLL